MDIRGNSESKPADVGTQVCNLGRRRQQHGKVEHTDQLRIIRRVQTAYLERVARLALCGRSVGVQGVLTLLCSGAAQVCHDNRVVELKEQLEVEEEDGDRREEEVEEKGEVESKRCAHEYDRG